MLSKFNTKTLLLIFSVLLAIIVITRVFDSKKGGRTFKSELVNIDTSLVNQIRVYPNSEQHKEIKISKSDEQWKVERESISAGADTAYVRNVLSTFALIKPLRLAATEKSKWKDYNVDDSLGTRVKLLSGEKILLDIVVGKFSFNNTTRSGISYLRLEEEDDIYAVDGFIPMLVNQQFNEWRNKNIVNGNVADWLKISFSYPDSSFSLNNQNGKWIIQPEITDSLVDSTKIKQFLEELSHLNSSSFIGNNPSVSSPAMWLTIEGNNMKAPITVKAFSADSVDQYFINSTFNGDAWFSAGKGNLTGRIFKKLPDFLKQNPEIEKSVNK